MSSITLDDATDISVARQVNRICTISRKRWRTSFAVIKCARAFKDGFAKKNNYYISPAAGCSTDRIVIEIDQPNDLTKVVREKNLEKLDEFGGVQGVASYLNTNVDVGINGDDAEDISRRVEAFGDNTYPKPPRKCFSSFFWEAFKDPPTAIFLACATLALVFGIKEHGRKEGWYDGGSMFVAVFLVTSFSAISNFKRQSRRVDKIFEVISNNIQIEVLRNGRRQQISIFEIVVGDVVCLRIGDRVPADGIFIEGHSLCVVHEPSNTGESALLVEVIHDQNPFLVSGSMVVDGYARMLVTSVGMNTTWVETMASDLHFAAQKKLVEDQLDKLSSLMWLVGAILTLVATVVCHLARKKNHENGPDEPRGIHALVEFIANIVNALFLVIPGGLPVVFALTISYSLRRITAKALVRGLSVCGTMNSVTTICTGGSGTLTRSKIAVTKFWLGKEPIGEGPAAATSTVLDLLHQAVSLNECFISVQWEKDVFSLSLAEDAILSWAVSKLNLVRAQVKQSCSILQVKEFNSEKRRSGVLIKKNVDNTIHVHWKGAAEMILEMCSRYYDPDGGVKVLEDSDKQKFNEIIRGMAASSLSCIAFSCKQISDASPDDGEINQELPESDLILLGILGLKDPCKKAVKDCQDAGVNIKMITGDDILKAKAIATEMGILGPNHNPDDGSVVEGAEFRNYTEDERKENVDKIVVVARSSPFDNYLLVKCIKEKGDVVAVIGDGKNDVPAAPKEIGIRLSMGIQGTHEISKNSADTLILDKEFTSVVRVLRWGRCTYNNLQKFTQFQLTAYISGLVIPFSTAIFTGRVPLTAIEALWINLIINPLGALALAAERPTKEQMEKPPTGRRTSPLITRIMWRNLIGQALYQIGVILALQFKGESIFGVGQKVNDTLAYNAFVLCQVFNQFNARRLEKKNIFEGIHRNKPFLVITGITIAVQVVMVELLNGFASTEKLDWGKWAACVGISSGCWAIGLLVKFIPLPVEND